MKRIKTIAPKDGVPPGPTCGLCGASVPSSLRVLCDPCKTRAAEAQPSQPICKPVPSSTLRDVVDQAVNRTRGGKYEPTPHSAEIDTSLPELRRVEHQLYDDPNPPMPGTKYRCSQCGTRYAVRISNRSCQVAWMQHLDSMARAIRWDADRDNDITPIDKALKRVYKWPAITRRALIDQYRSWYAFKHDEQTGLLAHETVISQAESTSDALPVPNYEQSTGATQAPEIADSVDDEGERTARSVPCTAPNCTAPVGETCRTANGQERPAHADRIKDGKAFAEIVARDPQAALDVEAVRRFLERCTEFGSSSYEMQKALHERFHLALIEASKQVIIAKGAWRKRHPDKTMYHGSKQLPPDDFLRGGVERVAAAV